MYAHNPPQTQPTMASPGKNDPFYEVVKEQQFVPQGQQPPQVTPAGAPQNPAMAQQQMQQMMMMQQQMMQMMQNPQATNQSQQLAMMQQMMVMM